MDKEILQKITKHNGVEVQKHLFCEECAEAIQAVQKLKRFANSASYYRTAYHELCGEIADVLITANEMRLIFGEDEIDRLIYYKLERQLRRTEREKGNE